MKKQKRTLENENLAINEECKNQKEKMERIIQEQKELTEAIELLKIDLEDIDENLLRVNLKINQANNEKVRMEEECKRYTKVGKQPKGKNA